ncbi:hypothetical protein EDD85DRAFT_865404 [Armillaria nabsnona]|nr:hypothetical protein EDD85DRAFT_865404 [Armillaria nabsnona]
MGVAKDSLRYAAGIRRAEGRGSMLIIRHRSQNGARILIHSRSRSTGCHNSRPLSIRLESTLLDRIEQIRIHIPYALQFSISCVQIKITGGGCVCPAKVSILAYLSPADPSLMVNLPLRPIRYQASILSS